MNVNKPKFGFNPRLVDTNIEKRFKSAVLRAQRLGFRVIEFSCTESRFEKGLERVFSPYFFEIAQSVPTIDYHVHAFYDVQKTFINSPDEQKRKAYVYKICEVIDFFEQRLSPALYVVHSGAKSRHSVEEQIDTLMFSFEEITSQHPEIHIAIENGRSGTLLGQPEDLLSFLNSTESADFVFDTGLGYNAVKCSPTTYIDMLTRLSQHQHRLVEIHWNNMASTKKNVHNPLHVPLEQGLDFETTMNLLARSAGVTHMIETPCTSDQTLPKERRVLLDAMTWLSEEEREKLAGVTQLSMFPGLG